MRTRGLIVALLTGVAAATACQDVSVTPVPVEVVRVEPTDVEILEGEAQQFEVQHVGAAGEELGGRRTDWSVDDQGVASVDDQGRVTGLGVGTTTVRARSEGREGAASVLVRIGPRIELEPSELEFTGPSGSGEPLVNQVVVSNGGNGMLNGLAVSIEAPDGGAPPDWISAEFDSDDAPAGLTVTVRLDALTPGAYEAWLQLDALGARNGPVTLPVGLEVAEALPVIGLLPSSVAFTSSAGSREPASQDVRIRNEGGGVLAGLQVEIRHTQGPGGWLEASLDSPGAPAVLSLEASARELSAGEYRAVVRVSAPEADPGFAEVAVLFSVGAAGVER